MAIVTPPVQLLACAFGIAAYEIDNQELILLVRSSLGNDGSGCSFADPISPTSLD